MPMARDLFVNKLLKKSFGQNLSPPELADRLLSPNRSEEERFKDLGNALGWIAKELVSVTVLCYLPFNISTCCLKCGPYRSISQERLYALASANVKWMYAFM